MAEENDFGDGGVRDTGFDVIIGDAAVLGVERDTSLHEAL